MKWAEHMCVLDTNYCSYNTACTKQGALKLLQLRVVIIHQTYMTRDSNHLVCQHERFGDTYSTLQNKAHQINM